MRQFHFLLAIIALIVCASALPLAEIDSAEDIDQVTQDIKEDPQDDSEPADDDGDDENDDDPDSASDDSDENDSSLKTEFLQVEQEASKPSRTCSGSGDPHYNGFDGEYFHFQGVGQFEAVRAKDFEVQVRNRKCGKHKTYGNVACLTELAIKQTVNGVTTVAQLKYSTTKVKINGKEINLQKGKVERLPNGAFVLYEAQTRHYYAQFKEKPTTYTLNIMRYTGPGGEQVYTYSGAFVVQLPIDKYAGKVEGLCGNADGARYKKDFVSRTGKDYNLKTTTELLGNSDKKPIHQWGLTWMVDDKNINSIFDDKAKMYNEPELKPTGAVFEDSKTEAKAKAICKAAALDFDFYESCLMDFAETGDPDVAEAEKKMQSIIEEHRQAGNYHDAKADILRSLARMEIEMKESLDNMESQKLKQEELMRRLEKEEQQKLLTYKEESNEQSYLLTSKKAAEKDIKTSSEKAAALREAAAALHAEHKKSKARILSELELVKTLKTRLNDLVNVKSASDIQADMNEETQKMVQELIDRAHEGHTDKIAVLLDGLQTKLTKELNALPKGELEEEKQAAIWEKKRDAVKKQLAVIEGRLQEQKKAVAKALDERVKATSILKQAIADLNTDNDSRKAEKSRIDEEMASLEWLRGKIVEWMSSTKVSPKSEL